MLLEWDVRKSLINKHKHGLSFEEVRLLLEKHGFIDTFISPTYPGQEIIVFRGWNGKLERQYGH